MVPYEAFFRGVALYAMTRRTGKRKYRRAAQKVLAKIDTWIQKGNPNVYAYFKLLKAEQEALNKKNHKKAESLYNEAIVIAG
mmetsp:Transcript_8725/g.20888  ORF Transcript_8725/g.20888 Transcript_8725/m.20888 type:complete len:82 (+) Transcript_8725:734-979(+)